MNRLVQVPSSVGSITIIKGCMWSGKSGALIHEANLILRQDVGVKIFAPDMSRRELSEKECLQSHDGVVALCETVYLPVTALADACSASDLPPVVCIDEAQFFTNLLATCLDLRRRGVTVIIAGLTLDSNRRPFGELHALLDYADQTVERVTVCHFCKRCNATLSFRTCSDKEVICVGGKGKYVPSCQLCFDEHYQK